MNPSGKNTTATSSQSFLPLEDGGEKEAFFRQGYDPPEHATNTARERCFSNS